MLALLVQSVVPVGYMPKAFADEDGFIQFCPQGVSDAVMAIIHANHGFSDTAASSLNTDQDSHDPLGVNDHGSHFIDHSAHHAHHHDIADQSDLGQAGPHQSHSSNWQNDCPYGVVTSGVDLDLSGSGPLLSIEYWSGYQPDALVAREIVARLLRQQRSRAPPSQKLS